MADLRHGIEPGCKGWVRITEQTYADLTTAKAEVERLQQALRDRDSEIVQEQIGDDAQAELKRLREALSVVYNVANGARS